MSSLEGQPRLKNHRNCKANDHTTVHVTRCMCITGPAHRRLDLSLIEATVSPGRPTLDSRSVKVHASETRVPSDRKRAR